MTTEAVTVEQIERHIRWLEWLAEEDNVSSTTPRKISQVARDECLPELRAILASYRTLSRPLPDREMRFIAKVGIRWRHKHVIESVAELLRLINGGAAIADIHLLKDGEVQS